MLDAHPAASVYHSGKPGSRLPPDCLDRTSFSHLLADPLCWIGYHNLGTDCSVQQGLPLVGESEVEVARLNAFSFTEKHEISLYTIGPTLSKLYIFN